MLDWSQARVLVTGGAGFLGRAVVRAVRARGATEELVFAPRSAAYDLRDPVAAEGLLRATAPTVIVHCAGLVGGLGLNRARPAAMFHDNLLMGLNVLAAAARGGFVKGGGVVACIGSMTSYPARAPLPYQEDSLFGGLPDPEIAAYGVGKLAVLQGMRAFRAEHGLRSVMPVLVNLYGSGDNVEDESRSHVAGAMIRRFVDAAERRVPEVVCWGTGAPTRDFVHVDDAAEGVVRCVEGVDDASPVNISGGREVSIRALAEMIAEFTGYKGQIIWDASKGDGVSRRCLSVERARERLGWSARIGLEEGFRATVEWYKGLRRARGEQQSGS
ncbi:MAG: NAD-dependent epimerase/dehydratase family protein [Phycisphaerales bacterium]